MWKGKHILLVEDNPDDVKLTLKAFQRWRVLNRVDVALDGVEALEYLYGTGKFAGRDATVLPALIVLDLKMPRINGIEVLQRIRADEKTKLVPVAIFTTSNEEKDRVESSALGANAYIRKPVKFSQFGEVIQQLGAWLALDTSPLEGIQG